MVRIIAGRAGGRRFSAPAGSRTRPTSDRVREAVFSAVVDWADRSDEAPESALDGIAWLDLYAGSGALALEAASRGAAPVLAVEADRGTATGIEGAAAELSLGVRVRAGRVETVLAGPAAQRYDVVWADPPYDVADAIIAAHLQQLVAGGWLAETALIVLERDARSTIEWPPGVDPVWDRRYGGTTVHYGHWDALAQPGPVAAEPPESES